MTWPLVIEPLVIEPLVIEPLDRRRPPAPKGQTLNRRRRGTPEHASLQHVLRSRAGPHNATTAPSPEIKRNRHHQPRG